MIKKSLVIRVLLTSFIFVALPLLVYFIIFFYREYQNSIKETFKMLDEASLYRNFVLGETQPVGTSFLAELEYFLNTSEEITKLPNADFDKKLAKITGFERKFDIFVLGKETQKNEYPILASNNPEEVGKMFYSYVSINTAKEKGKANFLRFAYSEENNKAIPYIYSVIALPADRTKETQGFLIAKSSVEAQVNHLLTKVTENDHDIYFGLVNRRGYIDAATDPNLIGESFYEISVEDQLNILKATNRLNIPFFKEKPLPYTRLAEGPNAAYFEFEWRDDTQLAALLPFNTLNKNLAFDFSFLSYTRKKDILYSSILQFALVNLIFGLIIIVGSIVAYWLAKWISKPLTQLTNLMKEVREGNLNKRFEKTPLGFEINLLGESFNDTLDSLLENMQKAEDERVKKETLQREIDIGKQVQQNLLPSKMPHVEGIEIAAIYLTAEEVGGDFYDISLVGNYLYLACADAAGTGISSCLYSLGVRSLLRTNETLYNDVGMILTMANNAFCEDTGDSGMFVTCQFGAINLTTKSLEYYSCGHMPAIIRKKDGSLVYLAKKGIALGITSLEKITTSTIQLESGDILIFYTNNLVKIVNEKGERFHEKKLDSLLKDKPWHSANDLVTGLKNEVNLFLKNSVQEGEITLLAAKIL